jgi:hypothetical protein
MFAFSKRKMPIHSPQRFSFSCDLNQFLPATGTSCVASHTEIKPPSSATANMTAAGNVCSAYSGSCVDDKSATRAQYSTPASLHTRVRSVSLFRTIEKSAVELHFEKFSLVCFAVGYEQATY